MANNLIKKLEDNPNFKKESKKTEATAPKNSNKKPRYNKAVQMTTPVYNRLKLYSFKNNIHMGAIVTDAVKQYLDNHDN